LDQNPCLSCGACCAFYRASFYWSETDDVTPGGVPLELTVDRPPLYRVMRGTDRPEPRCVALDGRIGQAVCCSIHTQRSSSCRDFQASYADGATPNPRCDAARARWGLAPLSPEDWREPDAPLRPAA